MIGSIPSPYSSYDILTTPAAGTAVVLKIYSESHSPLLQNSPLYRKLGTKTG